MKKLALVTGANRGIGFEIARELAKAGMEVLLASRDEAKGRAAAEKLSQEGLNVTPVTLDVSNMDSIQKAARMIAERYGRIDVLINNAGILPDHAGVPTPPETMIETFKTNTLGPYYLTEALFPLDEKEPIRTNREHFQWNGTADGHAIRLSVLSTLKDRTQRGHAHVFCRRRGVWNFRELHVSGLGENRYGRTECGKNSGTSRGYRDLAGDTF